MSGTSSKSKCRSFRLCAGAVQHGAHRCGGAKEKRAADSKIHTSRSWPGAAFSTCPLSQSGRSSTTSAWPSTSTTSAIRCRNRNAPRTTPTAIPVVKIHKDRQQQRSSATRAASPRDERSSAQNSRLFRHVPGHDDQHGGERRERDVDLQAARQCSIEHKDEQSMQHARPPGFVRRRGSLVAVEGDRSGGQKPGQNGGEAILAMPWATSSQLERWRRPVIPSATTAESSDFRSRRAARSYARRAGPPRPWPASMSGKEGARQRIAGCRRSGLPMVSTGQAHSAAAAAAATCNRDQKARPARRYPARHADNHSDRKAARSPTVCQVGPYQSSRSVPSGAGTMFSACCRRAIPAGPGIWLTAMMTAIPAEVKPTVTG